jgi:hypothetical protein
MKQRVSTRRHRVPSNAPYSSMIKVFSLFIALQSLALIAPRVAESAVIFSTISRRELSVGDRILFSVSTIVPKGATVVPPDPATSFGALVVKEWNSKKHELSKADSIVFDYVVTTYKAENCTIPSLPYYVENGTVRDSLKTVAAPLTVVPLCTADTLDIMDLKPQQTTGKHPLLWLVTGNRPLIWLGVLLAIAAGILARRYLRKLKKPAPPPPPKPPYDEAIEAIAALEAKQYLLKGMVREYVFELSDILKRYIERSFSINAAEFTTEEMLAWLGISPLDKSLRASMEWFFRAADPVKFAKYLPEQKSIDRFIVEARGFLEATKPQEAVPGEASNGNQGKPDIKPTASGIQKVTGGAG